MPKGKKVVDCRGCGEEVIVPARLYNFVCPHCGVVRSLRPTLHPPVS